MREKKSTEYQPKPLAEASTLPSAWYLDREFFVRERESIFFRSWQWVGRTEELSAPGDYVTVDLLGEPLVLARDEQGTLGAFFNVCRHRAGPVASGKGNRKQLQCLYHGWTYGLDGRLRRTPEMEGVLGFEPKGVCLPRVRVEEWAPLVFVSLDSEVEPLGDRLGLIPDEVARAGFPVSKMKLVERRDYVVEANWKVYVDNYLEGYHIPIVHPALFREVDYEQYRVETRRFHSAQYAPLRPVGRAGEKRTYRRAKEDESALYYWVFPNLMLNFYPGNLQVNAVLPIDHETTLTVFEWYGLETAKELEAAIAFSDEVQQEDMAICQAVQRGLRSRSYDRGRLSVRRENGVHHFHHLVHEFLRD